MLTEATKRIFAFALLGPGAVFGLAGCANANQPKPGERARMFRCEGEIGFVARLKRDRAIIETRSDQYELKARPSSVGVRYGSDEVAFAQDEERAVLIGAADGPYADCVHDDTGGE